MQRNSNARPFASVIPFPAKGSTTIAQAFGRATQRSTRTHETLGHGARKRRVMKGAQ